MPWWLYRMVLRIRLWRNSADWLNDSVDVQNTLLRAAKSGKGLDAEECKRLAYKLGVPREYR